MELVLISVAVIAIAMFAMAVGVMIQNKSLRGSCGGSEVFDCDGESLSCGACPNRNRTEPRKSRPAEMVREWVGPTHR